MLIDRDCSIAVSAFSIETKRVAQGLYDLGVREGDRVAVWLPNVPAWFSCLFACAQIGAIVVAVNTRFRSSEITDILERSGSKILILWPGYRGIDFQRILLEAGKVALSQLTHLIFYGEGEGLSPMISALGPTVVHYNELLQKPPKFECLATPSSPVIIFTTSGTTYQPKFVMHDQASIVTHAMEISRAYGFDAPDAQVLLTLPLCGTYGLCNALGAIAGGNPLLILPTFEPEAATLAITRYQVTHFAAAGDLVAQLFAIAPGQRPFTSVRLVVGARAGQAAAAEAKGITLIGVYGSSEIQAMVACHSVNDVPEERERGGGKLIAEDARVRARDVISGEILPNGTSGELEFLTPSRMIGYFGDERATIKSFTADGYFRSGDLGYTKNDREFVFESRIGDVMRLSGFLVNPLEIEHTLDTHPSICASQVVGVEGPRGQRSVAFVILRPGFSFDESLLIAYCRQRIAGYKTPERIFVIEEFPITLSANGNKVKKGKLREMAEVLLC